MKCALRRVETQSLDRVESTRVATALRVAAFAALGAGALTAVAVRVSGGEAGAAGRAPGLAPALAAAAGAGAAVFAAALLERLSPRRRPGRLDELTASDAPHSAPTPDAASTRGSDGVDGVDCERSDHDIGSWEWDLRAGTVWFDARGAQALGWRPAGAAQSTWSRFVHPEDYELFSSECEAQLGAGQTALEVECRALMAGGVWRWVAAHGRVSTRDVDGRPLRVRGALRDIDARKYDEHRLRREALVFGAMSDAVMCFDPDWVVVDCNTAAERLLGAPRGEMLGVRGLAVLGAADPEALCADISSMLGACGRWVGAAPLRRRTGEPISVELTALPLREASGDDVGVVLVARDVTEKVRADEELRARALATQRANEALRRQRAKLKVHRIALERTNKRLLKALKSAAAASAAKSAFLANMSHEIRTPITAILGFSELLSETLAALPAACAAGAAVHAEGIDQLATIRRNGEHLLALLNDILDLSKIEAGKVLIERLETPLAKLVRDVIAASKPRADAKQIDLSAHLASGLPESIVTDPTRLRQVLTNLVGNAVKFTDAGRVDVVVSRLEGDAGRGDLVGIEVRDTGIGMSATQRAKLFRPFSQADEFMTRRFGGTGLGLAISHKLMKLMGGTLSAQSVLGEGTTMTLTLPVGARVDAQPPSSDAPAIKVGAPTRLSGRVLVAEDGPDNRRLIHALLTRAGVTAELVENGLLAVERVGAAAAAGEPFDLVLMDMQMPVMDGYTATRRLREAGHALPILAITAHAMSTDRAKCIESGCCDYLTKPIDRGRLLTALARHLPASDQPPAPPVTAAPAS